MPTNPEAGVKVIVLLAGANETRTERAFWVTAVTLAKELASGRRGITSLLSSSVAEMVLGRFMVSMILSGRVA